MTERLRILLFEDNPGDAGLIEEMLQLTKVCFELTCVERLSSGLAEIKAHHFDVILLDLGLPDSQGISTLMKLNEVAPKAPVIVLTGLADEEVGTQAVKAGAQDFLIKGQIDHYLLSHSIRYAIERKLLAEAVQSAAREWSASFDAMSDGVSIHTVDCTIINGNRFFFELVGKSADEVVGKKCYQILHEKECSIGDCPARRIKETKQRGYSEIYEPTLKRWLAVSASPVFDDSGAVTRIVHTVRDINERRKLEEHLRQSQKMESVGTLTAGIAHDFNNLLTAIIGYGGLTLMDMAEDDRNRPNILKMLEASKRAASLTKNLLLFSRQHEIDRRPLDLNMVVARMENFLVRVIGEQIRYKTVLQESLLPVLADEHQLEQVLMNLATNSRDAMPQGGTLTMTTAIVPLDQRFEAAHGYGKPGSYALVTVTDTGTGIDKAAQERIFEPFFTTKGLGKGTGLGLSVVYGIIKQHYGYINMYSEPGIGTTFKIYLPLIDAGKKDPRPVQREEPVVGGTETILLAEDDQSVRKLMMSVLSDFGYNVIEAVDGADAVDKFTNSGSTVDLVLLDLVMPRMNGKEAYDEICKVSPGIKAIFSSGYAPDTIRQMIALDVVHLISKPVSPTDLLRAVRSALDGLTKAGPRPWN